MKLLELMKLNEYKTVRYRRRNWDEGDYIWYVNQFEIFTDKNGRVLNAQWLVDESLCSDWTEFHEAHFH